MQKCIFDLENRGGWGRFGEKLIVFINCFQNKLSSVNMKCLKSLSLLLLVLIFQPLFSADTSSRSELEGIYLSMNNESLILGNNLSYSYTNYDLVLDANQNLISIFVDSTKKDGRLRDVFMGQYKKLKDSTNVISHSGKKASDLNKVLKLKNSRKNINKAGIPLMEILFQSESASFFSKEISPQTRELICFMDDPYLIVLVERAIKENFSIDSLQFKKKILQELEYQQKVLMNKTLPYYSYENNIRSGIKFISIRTGNDLFSSLTTRNRDRDYTGSVLIELGTDWLNTKRRRPLKTYQTLLYGFDVYTPSFYDTLKFKDFNSYDTLDRPHASFQYIGWSKKGLSKYNSMRWQYIAKIGLIGGRVGGNFQTISHQDISNSLRPKGWEAQISNGGRFGWSIETGHDWQFYQSRKRVDRFGNMNVSTMIESKLGSYMTNVSLGLEFSNKNFATCNHNFIAHRVTQTVFKFMDRFAWSASLKRTHVFHNSMLEGYGILSSDEGRIDSFTPKSIYYLDGAMVNRWLWTGNARLSFTTTYFTLFYNWFIFSPETKLGKLNSIDERANEIDLSKRWHHFAEVGITFNLNRY